MNRLVIEDLEVYYRIGATAEERLHPQRLLLTVELFDCYAEATRTDDLGHTIDYAALCAHLLRLGQDRQWNLIERLADEVAQFILETHHPREVLVTVKKFVIPQARQVFFQLRRGREEGRACQAP